MVVGHHFGDARIAQIGDDTGEPVPPLGLGDLLRVHREPCVALDGDEALDAVIGEQLLGIVAALQPVEHWTLGGFHSGRFIYGLLRLPNDGVLSLHPLSERSIVYTPIRTPETINSIPAAITARFSNTPFFPSKTAARYLGGVPKPPAKAQNRRPAPIMMVMIAALIIRSPGRRPVPERPVPAWTGCYH